MPRSKDLLSGDSPDVLRRRDQPKIDAPATVPRPDEEVRLRGVSPTEDGGVEDHPIHDDDLEDLQPDDFEEMIETVGKGGFESVDPPKRSDRTS